MFFRRLHRRQVILVALIGALLGGSVGGYAILHQKREQANRIKAASCLRSIAQHGFVYANVPGTNPATQQAAENERLWSLLKSGGQVVLMRHDRTPPGGGDPANFKLDDRTTQRNLADEGRAHAERVGKAFRDHQIQISALYSSRYFRCLDTAELAFRNVKEEPNLNSAPTDAGQRGVQTESVKAVIARHARPANLVLVTHSVNIADITGKSIDMGEMLILTPDGKGGFSIGGRLAVP